LACGFRPAAEGERFLFGRRWVERMVSGVPDRALQAALQGVVVARGQAYPQSLDQALHAAAHTHLLRREPEAA
jgi:hypothetical protein